MYKILYAENNFENYKIVEFVLNKNGFQVENVVDGLEIKDKIDNCRPDLVIMDLDLPNLKQQDVTSWLKSKEEYKDMPVVALTADNEEGYKEVSGISGCTAYYTKPVDPVSFGSEIRKIIENKHENSDTGSVSEKVSKSSENNTKEVHNLNKKLRGYENKFSGILSKIPDIIVITNRNFSITYYNSSAIEKESFKERYISGMNFFELFKPVDMKIKDVKSILDEKGKVSNVELELEGLKGAKSFFLGNFDFTDDDEIAISLREVESDIKDYNVMNHVDKMAGLGMITSGIIHEINNPLTAIKTYLEVLKMKANDDTVKDLVGKIDSGFHSIEKLTNSLLSFARPSREKKYPINLNNIIKEVMNFSEYEVRRGNVSINFDLQDNIPTFNGIKSQIEQVVLNLLLNANHAVTNSENPEINVKTYQENGYISLDITDNGPGIDNNIQDKIFDPFFTTKPREESAGLGLAIVKHIVEKHNGILDFTSSDAGSNFIVKFRK